MKFSYNWICELVEGLDEPAEALMRLMTMKVAECEGVEEVGAHLAHAEAALLVSVEPIEGSHNQKVAVETKRYGRRTVVCGAPNARVGLRSVYVPPGVRLGNREIGKVRIDGVESDGMLVSAAELGIGTDHTGIIEVENELCLKPDQMIEVDNKSLTHRPDLWGHLGMAREIAAILGKKLIDPAQGLLLPSPGGDRRVEIANPELCSRYSALVFDNVKVGPSPAWLRWRLTAIGLNPINNIVDATNWIMAELGQPMHAFDADLLHGETIYVRTALAGESIVALNGETYALEPANLVIADAAGPVAIAGVIGGQGSAIHEGTTRIVLESACFRDSSIRKTSMQLKLRTEASMRFEKSQDAMNTTRALARAIVLLEQICPGIRLVGGLTDAGSVPAPPQPIELPLAWLDRKLGRHVERAQARGILQALGFGVSEVGDRSLSVSVPSWRATKDISIKDDLVEEIGRILGYDSIEPRAPMVPCDAPAPDTRLALLRHIRDMAAAQGFTEVYNYSFVSEEMAKRFGFEPSSHVRVLNPIAAGQTLLRNSLLPGILRVLEDNSRHFSAFRFFEIGREIHPSAGDELPTETPRFVAAMFSRDDGAAALFELKRLAECMARGCRVEPVDARPFEHPRRAAEVRLSEGTLGRLFELHPSLGLGGRGAVLDLDIAALERRFDRVLKVEPPRKYPTSAFDLSVVAHARTLAGSLLDELTVLGGEDIVRVEYLRQFALPGEQVSFSYRVTAGASDHTLSSSEVAAIRDRLIEGMRARGYELRV
jgi:phenylalanyl-tRNA synthetase beta chain